MLLLSCIGYNAFDSEPWILRLLEYTQKALQHPHVRVIGGCYGHQIVARVLGAKVAPMGKGAWEAGVCQVRLTGKGKELFGGKSVLVWFHYLLLGQHN